MPRFVAAIAVASGVAVVAFGVALIAIGPPSDELPDAAMPRATLEPATGDERADVTGTGIRGSVVDRDGEAVADVPVTLVPLFMDDGIDPIRARTDDAGRFSFPDVTVDPGSPWVAEATFDDARFPSDVLRTPRGKDRPVRIVVAPTTKKAKDLEIDAESLAIVGDKTGGQAVHALTVVNNGTRAFVGGLRLPLLEGATAIQEGAGLDRRFLVLGTGEMTSTMPILPGRHDLTYTYVVQMSRSGIAVDHRTQVPTERFELLVGDGLSLRASASLRDDGDVKLGPRGAQRGYHRYVARDLEDGDTFEARVSVASATGPWRIAGFAVAALLALLVIAAPLLRRRRSREPDVRMSAADAPASTPVPGANPPA